MPPIVQSNFINRTLALGTQTRVGDSTIGATYTETRFSDLTATQPLTLTDRGEVRYLGNWGSRLSAEGTAAVSHILQQGQTASWVSNFALSGVYDVNDASSLGAHVGQSVLNLNNVQNAYVRKKLESGLSYEARLGTWGLGLGFQHREEERVRSDHSYVDVPAWNSFDLKLNGHLTQQYRFGVKASVEDLTNAPVFLTDDPTLLYWSHKESLQAKLSGGNEVTAGYLSYTYRYRRNDDRNLSFNWYSAALGGSRVFSPKLLGYAELASDQYTSGGSSPAAAPLGTYFPSSETFMLGLDFTRDVRETFSFVMTSFYTEDEWGQQIALSYRLDMGKERYFQFTYSPWLQRDRLYNVDTFTAPILIVKVGVRF